MKILITGVNGFLGKAVHAKLKSAHKNVIAISRREATGTIACDLANPSELMMLLKRQAPDCIINIAAATDFGSGVLSAIYPTNTLAPAIIAAYCKQTNAYLLQTSSSSVHGSEYTFLNLKTPCEPNFDYGISKLLADQAILASGCRAAIIRFGGIFGLNGPLHLGINKAIALAQTGTRPKLYGTGISQRNYLYVQDGAAMIERCVRSQIEGILYAGGETVTIAHMLNCISATFLPGKQPEIIEGKDSHDQLVDVSPALGAYRSFQEALNNMRL